MNALWPPPIFNTMPKTRMTAAIQGAIIVFFILAIFLIWYFLQDMIRTERADALERARNSNESLARVIESEVSRSLDQVNMSLQHLGMESMRSGSNFDQQYLRHKSIFQDPLYLGIGLIAPDGQLLASTSGRFAPQACIEAARNQLASGAEIFIGKSMKVPNTSEYSF